MRRQCLRLWVGAFAVSTACASSSRDEQPDLGSDTTSADTTAGEVESSGEAESDGGELKLDVGPGIDGGNSGDCGSGGGELAFSYLWAANSGEGTVSKVDTVTMQEVGRYFTAPPSGFPSPSRTSVGLSGNVAVANRFDGAGITKIIADPEQCPDQNGVAGIQTSTGKDDVLEWGQDDCVSWNSQLPGNTRRPVAWSSGAYDDGDCVWSDEKVWTVGADTGVTGSVFVTVLDGDTGAVEADISIPELTVGGYGPYGAAFDPSGDFWFVDSGNDGPGRALVRVRADDHTHDVWYTPDDFASYGFTVDSTGRPWIVSSHMGGMVRFDPQTETFERNLEHTGIGIQEDGKGLMWFVSYPYSWRGVRAYDVETMQLIRQIEIPEAYSARGLSFDFFGKIMVVGSEKVYRIDPDTEKVDVYEGLTQAYTYSDMTGWGLKNVTFPPQG